MNDEKTPFAILIDGLGMNDYQIAHKTGASRSAIRALRVGYNKEPGYTLGLKLAALGGIPIPGNLRELERNA